MTRLMTPLRSLCLTVALGLGLAACGKIFTPPTLAIISVEADQKLNVDTRGRSTPVVVRYYLLKNDSAFNSADFFSLSDKDQQTLADSIMVREEFTLQPGERRNIAPKDATGAQTFAVMVSFRNIDRAIWRATAPLPPKMTTALSVSLKNDQVTIDAKSR